MRARRRVTYTVVRPENDAQWEPVLSSVDAGSRFLMFTHDAIRDALSELITCTHKVCPRVTPVMCAHNLFHQFTNVSLKVAICPLEICKIAHSRASR